MADSRGDIQSWMATYQSSLGTAYSRSCRTLFSLPPFTALRLPFTLMVSQTTPVPYEIFRSASNVLDDYGGPWYFERHWPKPAVLMGWETSYETWCEGTCIHVYSRGTCKSCDSAFSLLVNVTVEMNDYQSATNLAYNWGYSPALCDSLGATGERGEIRLSIGGQVMSDVISSVPCPNSISRNSPGWSGDPVIHSGNTTPLQFRSRGFIPINITFLKTAYADDKNLTWYFKGIHFEITTPMGEATELPSTPSKSNAVVIVLGVVVPMVAALIVLIFFFLWRKHRKNSKKIQRVELEISDEIKDGSNIASGGVFPSYQRHSNGPMSSYLISPEMASPSLNDKNHLGSTPLTQNQSDYRRSTDATTSFPLIPASTSISSGQSASIVPASVRNHGNGGNGQYPHGRGAPSVFSGVTALPPAYIGQQSSQYMDGSRGISARLASEAPNLAQFANLNRDLIPEELESKLMRAGYIPSDNPNIFTEDEWENLYGVSRLEMARIKELNARWKVLTGRSPEEYLS